MPNFEREELKRQVALYLAKQSVDSEYKRILDLCAAQDPLWKQLLTLNMSVPEASVLILSAFSDDTPLTQNEQKKYKALCKRLTRKLPLLDHLKLNANLWAMIVTQSAH